MLNATASRARVCGKWSYLICGRKTLSQGMRIIWLRREQWPGTRWNSLAMEFRITEHCIQEDGLSSEPSMLYCICYKSWQRRV